MITELNTTLVILKRIREAQIEAENCFFRQIVSFKSLLDRFQARALRIITYHIKAGYGAC